MNEDIYLYMNAGDEVVGMALLVKCPMRLSNSGNDNLPTIGLGELEAEIKDWWNVWPGKWYLGWSTVEEFEDNYEG